MNSALDIWMTVLRDKKTSMKDFRYAAHNVSRILAQMAVQYLPIQQKSLQTPIAETQGYDIEHPIMLVPILRSGIAMLQPFLEIFPDATIGIVGLKRDERTAIAHWYYSNIPPLTGDTRIIIIDPMIATGGTACEVVRFFVQKNVSINRMLFASIVSAPQGISVLEKEFPELPFLVAARDDDLTVKKFIIPGLGDFGDRFFGTAD